MAAKKAAKLDGLYTYAERTERCDYCGAPKGFSCRNALGRWRRNPHKARIVSAEFSLAAEMEPMLSLKEALLNATCQSPDSCGYREAVEAFRFLNEGRGVEDR